MSLADVLADGRAEAEARMTETFQFVSRERTRSGLATVDVDTPVGGPVPGRLKFTNTLGQDVEAASQYAVVGRREAHVPVGSVDAKPGAIVKVTASTADASLVGREFRVTDRPQSGQTTAWRYPVEEVS